MKKFLAMTLLSSAFLASVGCQNPSTTTSTTTTTTTKASTAPAATPSAAPSAAVSAAPSAAPSAAASAAPSGSPMGAASSAPAGAEKLASVKHPETGITMDLPENWKHEAKENDQMTLTKPDESVVLIFWMVPSDKMDEFNKNLDKEVGKYVVDQKLDESSKKQEELNGLKSFSIRGTGKLKEGNKPVEWEIWMVKGEHDKVLVMLGLGELQKNDATLTAIRSSVHQAEAAETGDKGADKGEKAGGDKGEEKTEE